MARIEDYALIGDCHSAALVSRAGAVDWLCLPRFDAPACFAALVGTPEHGQWVLWPSSEARCVRRWYRQDTLVLETRVETDDGAVSVIDFMPPRVQRPQLVRIVVGHHGRVRMRTEIAFRFDYGSLVPWVRSLDGELVAVAGPDCLRLRTDVPLRGRNFRTVGEAEIGPGDRVSFVLVWHPSHEPPPPVHDPFELLDTTQRWWRAWCERCTYDGDWREPVVRSLITLKALTYAPTGGLVAAPTTSLPEQLGGARNWDYRFCWIRDATFTLYALMEGGYVDEACDWRDWLVRAVAGRPSQIQALYGLAGERRLLELELPWLPGYEASTPVRYGNDAHTQLQLDVFGEVMDALHVARKHGLKPDDDAWRVQLALIGHLQEIWREPDNGIWEVRGPRRHYTHSKVMAWVAFDRMIKAAERLDLRAPVARWRVERSRIHAEVCERGFDSRRNAFVQSYECAELDASLLMLPLVGFLPPGDPRIRGTVAAIERELVEDGLVHRYRTETGIDAQPGGEATFLLCSFWLADNLAMQGRQDEARAMFEHLLSLRNDVGLLGEEYAPKLGRQLGNFPQAFSHVALVNTAKNLHDEPARRVFSKRSLP